MHIAECMLQICSDKVRLYVFVEISSDLTTFSQNKPNGQYELTFEAQAIREFMYDLSIRKVQGVGRVNERLLESIGIKVRAITFHRALSFISI